MMKFSKALMVLSTVALLAACGPTNTTDSENPGSSNTGDITNPDVPHSSETNPDTEKYTVKIITSNNAVTLKSDKSKASKGETVTITATINDSNYKLSKVKYDNNEASKVNDTTYTFVMPDHPVKVTCEVLALNGDVFLQGGLTAVFNEENGMYVARNVKVTRNTDFNLVVKGDDGLIKNMSIVDFDRTKTFANISFSSNKDFDLRIEGGATYDFYYDANNGSRPCYVKRVSIDTLPTTSSGVWGLFDGSIRSGSAVNPDNLISTTYVNTAASEKFVWNAYSDNTSLGEVYDLIDDSKPSAYVYAGIEGDKLTVVDNFAAAGNKAHKENYNLVKDNKKFSGEYKISLTDGANNATDADEFLEYSNYTNPNVANLLVNSNPFDMQTFECDIMRGYRVGYVVEDGVTQANVTVDSKFNDDGSFNVNLQSSRTYDSTQERNSSGPVDKTHYEYRIELTFTKAGALLTGKFVEKRYNDVEYDFDRNEWIQGNTDFNWENNGKVANKINISNTYGEKPANPKKFDTSKYIISKIKNFTVNNKEVSGKDANKLNVGDNAKEFVNFEYEPMTALNFDQYRLVKSSDQKVIEQKGNNFLAKDTGESTLTLGIDNGFGVKADCKVTIGASYLLRSIYIESRGNEYPGVVTSDSGNIYTGGINKFGIDAKESSHNKSVPLPKDISGQWLTDSFGLEVSFDHENKVLVIDATNAEITQTENVKLQINTASYDKGWVKSPYVFSFKLIKGVDFDELIGVWTSQDTGNQNASITFTKDKFSEFDEGYVADRPYKGKIVCSEGTFEFAFGFNASKNVIEASVPSEKFNLSTLEFSYDSETQNLKAVFVLVQYKDGAFVETEVFGYSIGEGYYEGDTFNKKA